MPCADDDLEDDEIVDVVDPEFFACEECRGPCRGHADPEPWQTRLAAMEIGLRERPEPDYPHDEVPLPASVGSVEAFTDEFDTFVSICITGHLHDRTQPWWHPKRNPGWLARMRRLRERRDLALAALSVIVLDPRVWIDCNGWEHALDHEMIATKLERCGLSISDPCLTTYLQILRARGEIPTPWRHTATRVRQR